jgi:DNA polymerase III subunit delta
VDFETFRGELRQRRIRSAYLFVGDQDLLKADALEEIRRAAGGERGTVRSFFGAVRARDVLEAQQNLSLLDPVAAIVVRQAAKLAKADAEELAVALDARAGGPTIVFWDEKLDKRIKLFDRIARAGAEIEFAAPRGDGLGAWIRDEARRLGHGIDRGAAGELAELVGGDLLGLRSTLERLSIVVGEGMTISADTVAEHVASSRPHAIYELQDAISARQAARAIGVFRRLLDEGGEPPALVGALVAQVRRLLLAREAAGANLPALLGVPPGRVHHVISASKAFSSARLRRAIEELADIDVASKTGRGDSVAALEEWLVGFCATERMAESRRVGPS